MSAFSKPFLRLLPEARELLRIPCGIAIYLPEERAVKVLDIIIEDFNPPLVVAVGDVITRNLIKNEQRVDVAIVDMKTRRDFQVSPPPKGLFHLTLETFNEAGTISLHAWGAVSLAITLASTGLRVLVLVKGEEDLLAIPAMLSSPDRSLVIYGLMTGALVATPTSRYLRKSLTIFIKRYFSLKK